MSGVDGMGPIEHEPGAIRVSAEDCENASLPAAAQTLRDLADEVEASRPQLRGAVEAVRAHRDRWYAANSQNPDDARPADRELWVAVLGSDLGGQS